MAAPRASRSEEALQVVGEALISCQKILWPTRSGPVQPLERLPTFQRTRLGERSESLECRAIIAVHIFPFIKGCVNSVHPFTHAITSLRFQTTRNSPLAGFIAMDRNARATRRSGTEGRSHPYARDNKQQPQQHHEEQEEEDDDPNMPANAIRVSGSFDVR